LISKEKIASMDHNFLLAMGLLMSNSTFGEFFDSYRIGIYSSGIPNERWNVVFVKRTTSKPQRVVEKWEQFFVPRRLPFRVLFSPGVEGEFLPLIHKKGYQNAESVPVMFLENLPAKVDERSDLGIRKVSTLEELGDFQEAGEKGFSLPSGTGPYVTTEQTFMLPDIEMFVGYAKGRPACTSMLLRTGVVAGIYWVSTLPEYRDRGFGAAITLRAVLAGQAKGCTFASLQASSQGKPVYERIGFENPYNYLAYRSPS
jgi:hypothetical protein